MYNRRVTIFVVFSILLLGVCLVRLGQMQLLGASSVHQEIEDLKRRMGRSRQLSTVRGNIVDRNDNVLATDQARFWVHINYTLSCFLDDRIRRLMLDAAAEQAEQVEAVTEVKDEISDRLERLQQIIDACAQLKAVDPVEITSAIQKINERVWNDREFQAWRRNCPNSDVFERYDNIESIPFSVAMADFEAREPDQAKRFEMVGKVDIAEMHDDWPLIELKTDDDVFAAQLEFVDTDGIRILPKEDRFYPYGSVAAQTIGWVGSASQERDKELFEDDKLLRYLDGELCGREDGVEYVCEAVLRGRRGQISSDIDGQLLDRTPIEVGDDVRLTLDIELQKTIENYLTDYPHDPNVGPGMSVVVIDVGKSEILALVSLPTYDLNRARYDYGELVADANKPLINRAINAQYPPGSVVKPLILTAGLETGVITPGEVIPCPAAAAPSGWPNCLIYRRNHAAGHDNLWANSARNAIRGSCNIYFSHLADRIDPELLQQWLYAFGYGRELLLPFVVRRSSFDEPHDANDEVRRFNQAAGIISSVIPRPGSFDIGDKKYDIRESDRRWFGIGQGNLRATPLQVANAMAALARGGVFRRPRLFKPSDASEVANDLPLGGQDLGIHPETMDVIYDGMHAVVNESHGTANRVFEPYLRWLKQEDVQVFGKTGSTERPEHAWFGGFAQDSAGHKIAIAVLVEGGQHGSSDAAPLARDIIQFCIDQGYLGKAIFFDDTPF
ncbi:MAG: penicillin-binding transpeptidase domain-containing protein [Sedimentisphaerales bacterium]|jgi:penicillin-binding protein 2